MSDHQHYGNAMSMRDWSIGEAAIRSAREAEDARELLEQLVASTLAAEARELTMLFWTRVAGVGALLALAVAIASIAVTMVVA